MTHTFNSYVWHERRDDKALAIPIGRAIDPIRERKPKKQQKWQPPLAAIQQHKALVIEIYESGLSCRATAAALSEKVGDKFSEWTVSRAFDEWGVERRPAGCTDGRKKQEVPWPRRESPEVLKRRWAGVRFDTPDQIVGE